MKTVRVATGYGDVPLPDGRTHNSGETISLTDDEYNSIPDFIKKQLVILRSVPDTTGTPAMSHGYTTLLLLDLLATAGIPSMLVWDGSDYEPSAYKSTIDRPKMFVGPIDPNGFTGVVLNERDQWINA